MKSKISISFLMIMLFMSFGVYAGISHIGRNDSLKLKLAQENLDVNVRINILNSLITAYWNIAPDSSLYYGNEALNLLEQVNNDTLKAEVLENIGVAHFYNTTYESALSYLYKALAIVQRIDDKNKTGIIYNSIGNLFYSLNNNTKAMEYYTRSLEITEKLGNRKMVASTLINMGSLLNENGQNEKAYEVLKRSVKISEQLKDSAALSTALNNLALVYKSNNNFEKALEYNQRALDISLKMNNFWKIAYISNSIGEIYLIQKKYEKAEYYLKQGLAYSKKIGTLDIMMNSYRSLTFYYSAIGNNKQFINYFQKYDAVKDSILTTQNMHSIAEMQVKYETEQKEKENALQKVQIAREKGLRNSFIFTTLLILIVVIFLFSRYRIKNELNLKLESKVEMRTADLLNNQRKLKEAQRIGKSGSWDWDLVNNHLDWSDELEKIFEVPPGQKLTLKHLISCIHPDNRQVFIDAFRKKFDPNQKFIYDFNLTLPSYQKKFLTLQWEITKNKNEIPVLMQGTIQDITERKQAEIALRDSEELYRKLIGALPDPVIQTDIEGNITFASAQSTRLFNVSNNEELLGTGLQQWVADSDKNKIKKCLSDFINNNGEPDAQFLFRRKDATIFPGEMKIAAVYFPDGNTRGLIVVIRDVTDRLLVEQRILRNTIETEERERTRFSEDLHDGIGPLLSAVKIHLELISARVGNPAEQQKFIEMTNELLDDSIRSTREIANNLTPNLLNDFGLNEALIVYVNKINKTGAIQIDLQIAKNMHRPQPHIEAAFYRILCELINNTLKHASATNIKIEISENQNHLLVYYMDNGRGFNVQQMMNSKNKGLGLSNVLSRIKSINGSYNFHSEEGKFFEATFDVDFTEINALTSTNF
mgnify:CR=1 FL=1